MAKPFKQKDEYFCIKQIEPILRGYNKPVPASAAGQPIVYDYDILGLGTDDKVYKLTPKGWVEYVPKNAAK